jgi:hypothetical protein
VQFLFAWLLLVPALAAESLGTLSRCARRGEDTAELVTYLRSLKRET